MSDFSGAISTLLIYPIKSCASVACDRATLTSHGLKYDRQWMIVDQNGQCQTQRQIPHLAWITPTLSNDTITLSAPGQPDLALPVITPETAVGKPLRPIKIWADSLLAIDLGTEANAWLDRFLEVPGKQFYLVQFAPSETRLSDIAWTGEQRAAVQFADGYAINVVSRAALDLFNAKAQELGLPPVDPLRFRPNIIIDGLAAHAEDEITWLYLGSENHPIEIALVKPCPRCQVPDIDPLTAVKEPLISQILSTYRQLPRMGHAICFGKNGVVRSGAGQDLYVNQPLTGTDSRFDNH
jgi:uncharacterized protein YcbX